VILIEPNMKAKEPFIVGGGQMTLQTMAAGGVYRAERYCWLSIFIRATLTDSTDGTDEIKKAEWAEPLEPAVDCSRSDELLLSGSFRRRADEERSRLFANCLVRDAIWGKGAYDFSD